VPGAPTPLPASHIRVSLLLKENVYEVVLQKSIPEQIRQLVLSISNNKR
jgi:hypothetical protein